MSRLRAGKYARVLVRWSLQATLLAVLGACNQAEANHPGVTAPAAPSAAQKLAPTEPAPTESAPTESAPTESANDGLDGFAQALVRTLDRSQMITRPASDAGGILHIPNGRAAHAAVLVRGPDGRLRRECVSSPAEVSALVQKMRDGAGQ